MQPETPTPGAMIGAFRNDWRRRHVTIYDHPTHRHHVITRGRSFDQPAPDVWTVEPRADYAQYIGTLDKVYR